MRLISWNVNGIRAVHKKDFLMPLVKELDPDILMLQEIKGMVEQFPKELVESNDYVKFYNSAEKKGYSGTGIWIKKALAEGCEFNSKLPNDPIPEEGRLAEVRFELGGRKISVLGIYFPNGGKSEQAWQDKLVYYERMLDYVNQQRKEGRTCIWAGDVNCAHEPIDLARPEENDGVIGFHPKERAWITKTLDQGWTDVFRKLHPDAKDVYSWWHLVTRARERNVGWRIDYFFCEESLIKDVGRIDYLMNHQGSDHCPVILDIF